MARSRREEPRTRSLCELVAEHVERLRVRGYAASTVQHRQLYLERFLVFCRERRLESVEDLAAAEELLVAHVPAWLAPLGAGSHADHVRAVQSFCRWLCREGFLAHDVSSGLELPRAARQLPEALTEDEVERVVAQANVARFWGLRARAAMEVLYSTAIRRHELLGLVWSDVDRAAGTVFIREGKGRKDRVVPIGSRALHWLDRYAKRIRRADDRIFPLTPGALGNLIERHLRAAGVAGNGGRGQCHLFRHTAATLMLRGGADVRSIQEMLGHAKLSTTFVYTHIAISDLKRVHAATHPAEYDRRR